MTSTLLFRSGSEDEASVVDLCFFVLGVFCMKSVNLFWLEDLHAIESPINKQKEICTN